MENLYKLDGKVPILKAIPFGLQHILAMFVANLSPITLIGLASSLKQTEIAFLLQNAMFIAGIATLIQLYPIWKIDSRLPIVMSVSFNFVFRTNCTLLEKIITPIVAASVVTSIGFSLFSVGTRSFGGGYSESFGSTENLLLGTIAWQLLLFIFCKIILSNYLFYLV